MSFATVKSSFEARCLLVMLAVLVALAVPASAAAFGTAAASAPPVADVPAQAGSTPWLNGAPSPLMVMLLGALIVGATVTRRVRKTALRITAEAARRSGRSSPLAAR